MKSKELLQANCERRITVWKGSQTMLVRKFSNMLLISATRTVDTCGRSVDGSVYERRNLPFKAFHENISRHSNSPRLSFRRRFQRFIAEIFSSWSGEAINIYDASQKCFRKYNRREKKRRWEAKTEASRGFSSLFLLQHWDAMWDRKNI